MSASAILCSTVRVRHNIAEDVRVNFWRGLNTPFYVGAAQEGRDGPSNEVILYWSEGGINI